MNFYVIKSKKGSVGFRSVVVIDNDEDLKKLQESYDVEKVTFPASQKKQKPEVK